MMGAWLCAKCGKMIFTFHFLIHDCTPPPDAPPCLDWDDDEEITMTTDASTQKRAPTADASTIRCRDACGAARADEEACISAAWTYLQISKGWRCPKCAAALRDASGIVGTDAVTEDTLPPISRGSLPRETASTILPPSLKA